MLRSILLLSILWVSQLPAQQFQAQLRRAQTRGAITAQQALQLKVQRLLAPDQLPPDYRFQGDLPEKSGTGTVYEVRHAIQQKASQSTALMKTLLVRPEQQTFFISPGTRFRVHYDTEGAEAVHTEDNDASGFPDYIEEVADALDYAYDLIVNQLGFKPPPHDNSIDGPEYDVYIHNLGNVYGWTNYEEQLEDDSWRSYIEMDNDYTHTPTKGVPAARVTAAHEFFHMVQLGYIGRDDDNQGGLDDIFLMEAASTWMEDFAFDEVNDYLFYLDDFFRSDNRPFDYPYGLHMYGLGIWFHFLEAQYQGPQLVRLIWEALLNVPALEAIDVVLRDEGSSFSQTLSLFHGWNYMTGDRADAARFYPEGADYPMFKESVNVVLTQDTVFNIQVQNKAARYIGLSGQRGNVTLAITNGQWDMINPMLSVPISIAAEGWSRGHVAIDDAYGVKLNAPEQEIWLGRGMVMHSGQWEMVTFDNKPVQGEEDEAIPPYPNPFLPGEHAHTRILLPVTEGNVTLTLFNAAGMQVKSTHLPSGAFSYLWAGDDDAGNPVPSGVYIVIAQAGHKRIYREKVLVVR